MIKLAVVILNWNGRKFLEQFLPSIEKNTPNDIAEIWVADNASTDDSIDFLKQNYQNVKILQLDQNYWYAGGYNRALKQIEADYYCLLNSDVEVTENWVEPVLDYFENHPEVAAIQPKIKAYNDKESFEYAGAAGGFMDKYGYTFCRGRIINTIEKDTGQYDDVKEIFWATGACLFIRSKDFLENELDEDFYAHMEEIDLCWRLNNLGRKVVYIPTSTVYHVGAGSLSSESPRKLFLNFRNNLFMLYKNLPKGKLFTTIFIRMILDGMSSIVFLFQLKFSYFTAVLKAHIDFYKKIKIFKNKRSKLLGYNKLHKEIYTKSIVFDYFIKKKSIFTKLNF